MMPITVSSDGCWEDPFTCRPLGLGCWSVREHLHVLQTMLMVYPNQAGSL